MIRNDRLTGNAVERRPSLRGAEQGAAVVELAVTLPLLVVIVLGTIDFGRVFYTTMELTSAARAGAQYGAQSLAKSVDTSGIAAAATASAPDIGAFTVTSATTCVCATAANPSASSVSCSGSCGSGHLVVSVTVAADKLFSTFTTLPGIPHTLSLTRTATMRAQ